MAGNTLKNITFVTCDHFQENFSEKVVQLVETQFPLSINLSHHALDLNAFFDPHRKQYDANKLLRVIDQLSFPDSVKTIGLFRIDLYIPILTYIFGQAFLGGKSGIVSYYRLKNELYGLPNDEALLWKRFAKVIIHELGHCFGLKHCYIADCVMISSTYVEDLDQKSHAFCNRCKPHVLQSLESA